MLLNINIGIKLLYHCPDYLRDSSYIINKNQFEYNSVILDTKIKKTIKKQVHQEVDEEGN